MRQQTVIQTFLSRFLILALNFGLVIFTTNFWGSEGKGIISLVIADLAIVGFFTNIFVGSSVTYFAPKLKKEQILLYAYIWSIIAGVAIPIVFSYVFYTHQYLIFLIGLCVSSALLTAHINLFVGNQNIQKFNIYSILQQLVHAILLVVFIYFFKIIEVEVYFLTMIFTNLLLFVISFKGLYKNFNFSHIIFSEDSFRKIFNYGWKTQLSAFLQFLNYRLSYYFLGFYKGISSVGVFSVGVAVSEAILMVSRSLSVVLYADVVNSNNQKDSIVKTKKSLKISFLLSFLFIVLILIVPSGIYSFVFGKDFSQTKQIILLLSPGILALATSDIIGYYFAGIHQLKILNIKSIIGLVFTIFASLYAIPKWGILGACLVTSVSYCLTAIILFWKFYQDTKFSIHDFILSETETRLLLQSLKNKFKS